MAEPPVFDVVVHVCHRCSPGALRLPRQFRHRSGLVVLREVPCSGKVDVPYLLRGLEAGLRGVIVVGCPPGACQLSEGNQRSRVRVCTTQKLLAEIGFEPDRVTMLYASGDESVDALEQTIRDAVDRLWALGPSPLGMGSPM